MVFQYRRPVALLGPEETLPPKSLRESAIVVHVPDVEADPAAIEARIWETFDVESAGIFAWFLDGVAASLRAAKDSGESEVRSFVASVEGAAEVLGCPKELIAVLLEGNREEACGIWLEASPIGPHVEDLTPWDGTATQLQEELDDRATPGERNAKDWPKNPRALSVELRSIRSALRGVGIEVVFEKSGDRIIHLKRIDG